MNGPLRPTKGLLEKTSRHALRSRNRSVSLAALPQQSYHAEETTCTPPSPDYDAPLAVASFVSLSPSPSSDHRSVGFPGNGRPQTLDQRQLPADAL